MDTPGNSTPNTCINIDFVEDGIYWLETNRPSNGCNDFQ